MTIFSGGFGKRFDGNSILVQITSDKYVYIGPQIFSFTPKDKVVKYVSPVGNNDVPYPYAIDEKGRYYLLTEGIILEELPENETDPYDYYYIGNLITEDKGVIPPRQPKIKNFNDIVEYYIDKEGYTLNYDPTPAKDYERLIPEYGKKMYVVKTDGKKYELTKEMYIKLMKDFGKVIGISPIKYTIIQKRL